MGGCYPFIAFIITGDGICAYAGEGPEDVCLGDYLGPIFNMDSLALAQVTARKLNEVFENGEILLDN